MPRNRDRASGASQMFSGSVEDHRDRSNHVGFRMLDLPRPPCDSQIRIPGNAPPEPRRSQIGLTPIGLLRKVRYQFSEPQNDFDDERPPDPAGSAS